MTGAPSDRLTDTGTSATRRGFGISWLASFTGQTIEARRPGRVTVFPSIWARPKIFALPSERGAFSSALISNVPTDLPAGIFKPQADTPSGRSDIPSSISPSNPSRRTTTTSSAIVAPAQSAIGLESALRSPFLRFI